MRVSVQSMLVPGMAVAAVGIVGAVPVIVAAPPAPQVPAPAIHAIQLAGIGQDIYNAITPVVQYVVGGTSYLVNFTPLIGGPIAAQININYFQGIQPAVAATVDYGAALVHDPLDFVPITGAYAEDLFGIGYDVVSAELRFFGLQELPPRPAAGIPMPDAKAAAADGTAAKATPGEKPAVAVIEELDTFEPDRRTSLARGQARVDVDSAPAATSIAAEAAPAEAAAGDGRRGSAAKPTRSGREAARSGAQKSAGARAAN